MESKKLLSRRFCSKTKSDVEFNIEPYDHKHTYKELNFFLLKLSVYWIQGDCITFTKIMTRFITPSHLLYGRCLLSTPENSNKQTSSHFSEGQRVFEGKKKWSYSFDSPSGVRRCDLLSCIGLKHNVYAPHVKETLNIYSSNKQNKIFPK